MNKIFALLLAALVLLLALPVLGDDTPKCKLLRVADWHVRLIGTHPVIDGSIKGQKIGVVIDTGAYLSLLTKSAAKRLEIPSTPTTRIVSGMGGGTSRMSLALVEDLRIGDFAAKELRVWVAGEQPIYGVDFVLGQDLLKNVDIEFDYANGAIRLYQPVDCKFSNLAYWDPAAQQLPLYGRDQDRVEVKLNGTKAEAFIDSAGGVSMVQIDFAKQLGITPTTPGVQTAGCAGGIGAGTYHEWIARFDSIAFGGETIRNPHLLFGPIYSEAAYWRSGAPDMMLAGDFLKSHHVLISHSQNKVYVSYSGGQVFPATPNLDCDDETVRGKKAAEALASYDEALANNPSDVKTLLRRAALRYGENDFKGALSDADAAVRIEPADAVALTLRSRVRFALKDYDGALADSSAAIERGMRSSQTYLFRAAVRHAAGDTAAMLAEFDEALKLDPHDAWVLRARGRHLYFVEKYPLAEADFKAAMAITPTAFDSMWLHLTTLRQGTASNATLEQGLTLVAKDEWPAPVIQYLLDRIDYDALMKVASADEKEHQGRECESRFYTAERFLAAGKKAEARPLLEAAVDQCPKNYIEYESAIAELDRLK